MILQNSKVYKISHIYIFLTISGKQKIQKYFKSTHLFLLNHVIVMNLCVFKKCTLKHTEILVIMPIFHEGKEIITM